MDKNNDSVLSANLFFLSAALSRRLSSQADEQFAEFGLSGSHALLLMLIGDHPRIQPGQLAQKLHLKPSTITRLVNKLERRKLVERHSEGRASLIVCTSKGDELVVLFGKKWKNLSSEIDRQLGERYAEVLGEMMQEALRTIGD